MRPLIWIGILCFFVGAATAPMLQQSKEKPAETQKQTNQNSKPETRNPKLTTSAQGATKQPGTPPSSTAPKSPAKPKSAGGPPKPLSLPKWNDVLATVNGVPIRGGEVLQTTYDWFSAGAIEELILEKLIEQDAKKRGVKLNPAELEDRFLQSLQQAERQVPPGMSLDDFLRRNQFPRSRLYARTRIQMLAEKVAEQLVNLDDFVQVRQLVIRIPGNTPEEQEKNLPEVQQKINEAHQKIKEGLDFAEAVKTYSTDTFTKDRGGILEFSGVPYYPRQFLMADLQNQLKNMKPGDLSEPFRTIQGYTILKFEKTGKQATPQEKTRLIEIGRQSKVGEYVRDLQAKAKITNKIVKPFNPEMAAPAPRPTPRPPAQPRPPQQPPQQPPQGGQGQPKPDQPK